MRFFGFLFLLALALGLFGWFRGWFSVTTAHAGDGVTVHVDESRIRDDSRAARGRLADTAEEIAEVVKSLGRRTKAEQSTLHGIVTAIDAVERDLTVQVEDATHAAQSLRVRVPDPIAITRDGSPVGWDDLRTGSRVQLTFADAGEARRLARVELLP